MWIGHTVLKTLQWRYNERDGILEHWRLDCLLNRVFRRRSKKTPKLRVTGLCEGHSPVTGELPAKRPSNAETVPIWWRHHSLGECISDLRITENAADLIFNINGLAAQSYYFKQLRIIGCPATLNLGFVWTSQVRSYSGFEIWRRHISERSDISKHKLCCLEIPLGLTIILMIDWICPGVFI